MNRIDQLNWYKIDMVAQDYDLLQFIVNNGIGSVKYLGDADFLKPIIQRESNNPTICIYIANQNFKFDTLLAQCNLELRTMPNNSFLYLSINKFLAHAEPTTHVLSDDYDDAIFEYVKNKMQFPIIKYYNGKHDYGQKFNWLHPLTRFYFSNENTV